jgi:hypothetical protein
MPNFETRSGFSEITCIYRQTDADMASVVFIITLHANKAKKKKKKQQHRRRRRRKRSIEEEEEGGEEEEEEEERKISSSGSTSSTLSYRTACTVRT